jgi:transcriptional regulator with XRE-family HTH domain
MTMMASTPTPAVVARAQRTLGDHVTAWRKLRRLTVSEVADRAGIGETTVIRLENGRGTTVENLLRVARALGVMDELVAALDPYSTDVGRLRSDQTLPDRVRHRRTL